MEVQLKSAREMFEELGYELVETNSAGVKLTMIEYYNFETTSTINFWTPINIDIDLLKAINQQIKELGWK